MKATLRAAVDRLATAGLDHVALREEAAAVLRRHLDFDAAVWATVDPVTVMWTHCLLDGFDRDERLERAIFANEYGEDDVGKLTDLLAEPTRVGSIHAATGGDVAQSRRHEELLGPLGFRDECRMVLADGDTPWGALHLLRSRPFDPDELRVLAALGPTLAVALRRSLVRGAACRPGALHRPPGVIELGPDDRIAAVSPEAEALIGDGAPSLPQVVDAVVAKRRSGRPAPASLAGPEGGWLTFFATTLGGRPVVIVEPADPHRLSEIIVRSHGLTPREREIVECLARGLSTRAIADRLFISEWTVQDHLKSVFAKFGVSSRAEVVAAVFFDHYLPMHDEAATPSPRGWYLDEA